jgi:nicotinamidase-related amidase
MRTIMNQKTALLVIDVQRGLFDRVPRPLEAAEVIDRINTLSAAARAAGCPVVFIQHERPASPLEHGSDNWQLAQRLLTQEGDLRMRKTTPDSFLRTHLASLLQDRGIRHVVVAGYACEFCVDTTTRRAAALGYAVTLAADAHTTHDKPHARAGEIRAHENATLPSLTSFGPKITAVPAADIRFAG